MAEAVLAEEQVDRMLREVLGYLPEPDDDLTEAIDSMQRLEMLIALEESLSLPFHDEELVADWWATRAGIVGYVTGALAQRSLS